MRCSACSHDNLPGARFCSQCGVGLECICASCGHANGSEAQFCTACGQRLVRDPAVTRITDVPADRFVGERRQLTVLFCDIVGSTELAARHDPEDWQSICARYQRCSAETVERLGGYVAQFLGDGLLTYFGYPLAHDDGPERGVRAGLAILDAMVALNAQLEREFGVRLAVRVGVHTGEVVIGEGGGRGTEVFGEAVHVAARVQQLAGRDEVLVTNGTYRLVPGLFLMEERGTHALRGIPRPVDLYRVIQPSGVRGRFRAGTTRGLTPFVGREAERALLRSRFERAQEAAGQVVLICGEPGIGKSRLVQVFREDLAGCAQTWIECGASPYHESTPFFCVIDMLQEALALQCGDSIEQRVLVLERALATTGLNVQEALPLIASLIGLAIPERYPPLAGSPAQQRQRTLATLVRWVVGAAARQPVVLVVEDVMWADPSTLELLELLGQQAASTRVLLLYTARPDFRHAWPVRSNFTTVTLDRLSQPQVRQMIASALPDLVETLVARSDGVPLFAEELLRLVEDTGRAPRSEIPATLQDLLTARLDRLGATRRIAQVGAVIGREFSYGLLHAVSGASDAELNAALARLTEAELLHARGLPPDATYVFKHALIRDAAYNSLLKGRRRELHTAIARALAERDADPAEAQPELVAHHYTEAGETEAAWRAWQRAGDIAVARSALREAADHFTTARELLETLPDTPERAQDAIGLQIRLGQALAATKGYGSRDVTDAFARARELARRHGGAAELLSVLFGLWTSIAGQGEMRVARELAEELLAVAERAGMRSEMVWGHLAHGINYYSIGEGSPAREHLAEVVALYREVERPASPSDPGVMALSYACLNSWMLGLIDEARARSREALELAERLHNPFAVAWAGFFTAAMHVFLGEPGRALAHTDPLLVLCADLHYPLFVGLLTIVRGAAISAEGRHEEGLTELRRGIEGYAATGQRVSHRLYLCWLAQACADAGAIEEASATVTEALAMPTDERLFEPELHRLHAELLVRQGVEAPRVEASFRAAVDLAQRQTARSLELRAATSYARWLQDARRIDEARRRLGEVCGWFPEGLDTGDLRTARTLLRELSVRAG